MRDRAKQSRTDCGESGYCDRGTAGRGALDRARTSQRIIRISERKAMSYIFKPMTEEYARTDLDMANSPFSPVPAWECEGRLENLRTGAGTQRSPGSEERRSL